MQCIVGGGKAFRRGHLFEWGSRNLRRWLLYHTLIHEVGHWVNYLTKVVVPVQRGENREENAALPELCTEQTHDAFWEKQEYGQ